MKKRSVRRVLAPESSWLRHSAPPSDPVTLEVGEPKIEIDAAKSRVGVPVRLGDVSTELRIRYPLGSEPPDRVGDALLLWFILPAMRRAARLRIASPVSRELLERIPRAQEIWSSLPEFEGHRFVSVDAPVRPAEDERPSLRNDRGAAFAAQPPSALAFSGGVDSVFSALRHHDEIAFLVYLHCLDRESLDDDERALNTKWLREAADACRLRLVDVDTNYREVMVGRLQCRWDHAFVMAPYGMAHLLHPHIRSFLIGGEVTYAEMQAITPSTKYNPLLDPWVSSDAVKIRVDGMSHRRHEKIAALKEHREVLSSLWVCSQRVKNGYAGGRNCGECEKCLRTMAALRLVGADGFATAFDQPLDLDRLRGVRIPESPVAEIPRAHHRGMLEEARRMGSDPELQHALEAVVARFGTSDAVARAMADALAKHHPLFAFLHWARLELRRRISVNR